MIQLCFFLKFDNKDSIFCWVPSHRPTGIGGNEKADSAAKSVLELLHAKVDVPYTDFKHFISQYILSTWQGDWNGAVANKIHSVTPVLGREREIFYLTTHSTHFIYGYMASDIWLRTILIVRKETRCRLIGYSYRLTTRVLLYAPSHRQDNTYHGLCYTSRGALAGTRNSSMGSPHEGSIRRPIAP